MAQMTESLALEADAHCEAGNMPPLTVWEVRQLIHGWMLAQKTRDDADQLGAWVTMAQRWPTQNTGRCARF